MRGTHLCADCKAITWQDQDLCLDCARDLRIRHDEQNREWWE